MTTRPLRQYYEQDVTLVVDDSLGTVIEPWLRHRERFLDSLRVLETDEWDAPTRCAAWTARDVVSHLITVDGFFAASLAAARSGTPTTFLTGFDPIGMPELLVAPMRVKSTDQLLEDFAVGQAAFVATVEDFAIENWTALGESPIGHVPARLVLAHAFWDSWVHERDVFAPLGRPPGLVVDEVFTAVWYSLFVFSAEGGLVDDAQPVGALLDTPIDVQIGFDDVPGRVLRLQVDHGVRLGSGENPAVTVSAVDLVESSTGRGGGARSMDRLPNDLRTHLERGQQIF
jgi:uncharacterized protein (TIGR03083 family)